MVDEQMKDIDSLSGDRVHMSSTILRTKESQTQNSSDERSIVG